MAASNKCLAKFVSQSGCCALDNGRGVKFSGWKCRPQSRKRGRAVSRAGSPRGVLEPSALGALRES